jgi:lipopolysaccharide export system permease protein
MLGRLIGAAAMIAAVIAVEEILRKSLPLYGLVVSGTLSVGQLFAVWLFVLPVVFYHATPEMASLAVAWMYHRWIDSNELLTLRGAGLSSAEIARPGIIVAVLAGLFCAVNSWYLLAPSWRGVEDVRHQALAHIGIALLRPGYQQQIIPGVSITYTRRGSDGATLENVILLDRRKRHKAIDIWARRGGFAETGHGRLLWLEHGVYLVRRGARMERVAFETFSIPLAFSILGEQSPRRSGVYEQAVGSLLVPPEAIREDPVRSAAWQIEGHHRLISPLLCCGSVVLVLGLMVPGRQSRFGSRIRFLLAVVLALATNTLPHPLFEIAVRNVELLPFLYLLPTLPGIVGVLLLVRGDRRLLHFPRAWRDWHWRPTPSRPLVEETA